MPRGEGGYKSKNKTKDGKNKSWIGKKKDGSIGRVWAEGYGPDAKKKKATTSSKAKPKAKPKAKAKSTAVQKSPRPVARPTSNKAGPARRRRKSTGGKKTTPAATMKTTTGSKGRNASRGKPTMAELASGKATTRPKARPTKPTRRRKSTGGKA